ncbi:hypothetical protein PAXINDRAFT_21513 [Paxillus involutus ATCC 200175]|uniref:Uncharacterized protein n=1 Tax=Paxillus involutus ATCC 200175 TaxID=664439 RepID=A0A0C9T135_PAXIN|nr:hypothetical protein PAXINDRAFT_21513 [Paxillus involutus ATCC 200175]
MVVSLTETIHVAEAINPHSPRDDSMFPAAEPQAVPLPAMYEVMATHAIRQTSSNYFNQSGSKSGHYYPLPANQIAQSYHSENPPVNQPVPQWAQPDASMSTARLKTTLMALLQGHSLLGDGSSSLYPTDFGTMKSKIVMQ